MRQTLSGALDINLAACLVFMPAGGKGHAVTEQEFTNNSCFGLLPA